MYNNVFHVHDSHVIKYGNGKENTEFINKQNLKYSQQLNTFLKQ